MPDNSTSFASGDYWEARYSGGRDSGKGSYGDLAEFKATVLNSFVQECGVRRVIELGSGDGNQASYFRFHHYVGIDVSETAVAACQERFAGRSDMEFQHYRVPLESLGVVEPAELSLSLDVIYHLVEDVVFEDYLAALYGLSSRFVMIYSSNFDEYAAAAHVRHRFFTDAVAERFPQWGLRRVITRPPELLGQSPASFYLYEKTSSVTTAAKRKKAARALMLDCPGLSAKTLAALKASAP